MNPHERPTQNERGFTLPEVLVSIAILGILLAIAIIIWLGILEARRVDAATNQLKAGMRLAHASAANQLTDWRVVLAPDRTDEDDGPDYHLVRLAAAYPNGGAPVVTEARLRTFPGDVKVVNVAGALDAGLWMVAPSEPGRTRTLEFNSDGAMRFYGAVSGSTCVTVDGDPENRLTVAAATSRVKVRPDAC
jgi:prepilin-type N-terminal cleavage/methylation domain-containing protein